MKFEVELKKQVIEDEDKRGAWFKAVHRIDITELPEPEWLPIDRIGEFEDCESLWGYYKCGYIWKGARRQRRKLFVSHGQRKSLDWDINHQPTHIMLRVDDVKPEPPEVEPTLYEQVQAICEGEGMKHWGLESGIWGKRAHALFESQHREIYDEAVQQVLSFLNIRSCYSVTDEYHARLICDFALKIAKEQHNG